MLFSLLHSCLRTSIAINYHHCFLPNLSTVVGPLNKLLQKVRKWNWSSECKQAFVWVKELVTPDLVFCHFDPNLIVRVASDASPYGIGLGAVISYVFCGGTERPVANLVHCQDVKIDKEVFGIFKRVTKFHTYFIGRHFTIVNDHKPLFSKYILRNSYQRWQQHVSKDMQLSYLDIHTILNIVMQRNTVMLMSYHAYHYK